MPVTSTTNYDTLRRTRALVRLLSPVIGSGLTLLGLSLFVRVAPELMNTGNSIQERLVWGIFGLAYLMGLPFIGYVLFFSLRAMADLIDLWINDTISAERTAGLIEQQLVPSMLRMCQLLERLNKHSCPDCGYPKGITQSKCPECAGRQATERRR